MIRDKIDPLKGVAVRTRYGVKFVHGLYARFYARGGDCAKEVVDQLERLHEWESREDDKQNLDFYPTKGSHDE